jgi:hypothetical protein
MLTKFINKEIKNKQTIEINDTYVKINKLHINKKIEIKFSNIDYQSRDIRKNYSKIMNYLSSSIIICNLQDVLISNNLINLSNKIKIINSDFTENLLKIKKMPKKMKILTCNNCRTEKHLSLREFIKTNKNKINKVKSLLNYKLIEF